MGTFTGIRTPAIDGLKVYIDVNNRKCLPDPDAAVSSSTKLYNLMYEAGSSSADVPYLSPSGNSTGHAQMSFPTFNGRRVAYQDALAAGAGNDPGWLGSMTSNTRVGSYTFSSWFRYRRGSSYQLAENIYGGGFSSQTSFYMCWGGTADDAGVLHYSPGNVQNYSHGYAPGTSGPGGSDDLWHHHVYSTYWGGSAGTWESRFYVDGVNKNTSTNQDTYTPWTSGTMTWGSWSGGYGNYSGYMNHFMYFERQITDAEVLAIYNAQRPFYGI